jgi:NAD(P)-dependent dehydrogenase (short-subunit alcohol dehydrogenase family)
MTSLVDQTVLVTGANRGMGREYVTQLLDRGVSKVYAAARDPLMIDAAHPRVVPLQLDVTDSTSIAKAAQAAPDVSVLINNAGIARGASVLDQDTSKLRGLLETNLFGPLTSHGPTPLCRVLTTQRRACSSATAMHSISRLVQRRWP